MLIEIDDAGIGSLVGGMVIGVKKGDKYLHEVIPVSVFRSNELYINLKNIVANTVLKLLNKLGFDDEEDEILLCQGDIFSKAAIEFRDFNLRFSIGKIDSSLQDYVETAFDLHLTTLGVPRDLLKRLRDYRDYTLELIKWIIVKLEEREKNVKSLYPIWGKKWSRSKVYREEVYAIKRRYCINCGKPIEKGDKVHKINIVTPQRKYVTYSHIDCDR